MPFGMWTMFAGSFQKQLTAVLDYDTATARAITKKAKPKYKEIIAKLPEFEKGCKHGLANANIVFALPLRSSHFPRKSHSLRRIYAQGSSPFLLGYEKHPNYLGRAFENTCAEVKNRN